MAIYSFKGIIPKLDAGVFIAPSADVIGKIHFAEHVSLWHQCVARGDVNWIKIGKNTNVQDLSMLHVTKDFALTIGECVSVGHSVTLHGCTIGNHCLIGMGAVILDGAEISDHCVVAAGALVAPGKKFPPKSMIMGNPAVVKRTLTDEEVELYGNHYKAYVIYKEDYLDANVVKKI